MANSTVAKPTTNFAAWDSTAATVGAAMRMFVPLLASGDIRDVVTNALGVNWYGDSYASGNAPSLVSAGFTGGGRTDACYRWTVGTPGLMFRDTGWTGAAAAGRTFFLTCKVTGFSHSRSLAPTFPLFTNGDDGFARGIGYSMSGAGVITLGSYYSGTVTTSGFNLTSGDWYLISMTETSTTGRLFNIYNLTTDAYVTPSGTGTAITVSSPSSNMTNEVVIGSPTGPAIGFGAARYFDIDCAGLHNETFDPATNAWFAALVADRQVAARGTYAPGGGTLLPGGICLSDTTPTTISLRVCRPTAGAAADQNGYQYRLHRSTTASFTPDTTTRIGSLVSTPLFVDSTAAASTNYFYKAEIYDGSATVYSTTAVAPRGPTQVIARRAKDSFSLGLLGDSRAVDVTAFAYGMLARGVRGGVYNTSLGGSAIRGGSAGSSWQPSTTLDPVNGQPGYYQLDYFITACTLLGITKVAIMLGVNDSDTGTTFTTNCGYVANAFVNNGITCYFLCPYPTLTDEVSTEKANARAAELATLDNGSTINYVEGNKARDFMATFGLESFAEDYLHAEQMNMPMTANANDFFDHLYPSASGGGGGGGGTGGGVSGGIGFGLTPAR